MKLITMLGLTVLLNGCAMNDIAFYRKDIIETRRYKDGKTEYTKEIYIYKNETTNETQKKDLGVRVPRDL